MFDKIIRMKDWFVGIILAEFIENLMGRGLFLLGEKDGGIYMVG